MYVDYTKRKSWLQEQQRHNADKFVIGFVMLGIGFGVGLIVSAILVPHAVKYRHISVSIV
jgi:hypothetical protein